MTSNPSKGIERKTQSDPAETISIGFLKGLKQTNYFRGSNNA